MSHVKHEEYHDAMEQHAIYARLSSLLVALGPLATLIVTPFSSLDPINLAKMFVLSTFSAAILFMLLPRLREVRMRLPKVFLASAVLFIVWLAVTMVVTEAPISQQFWGVFGRNNGFLTFSSLVIIVISTACVQNLDFYRKLVIVLVMTAVPMTVYAILQLLGRDPISWSVMAPFATLGNINFSSAFFGMASLSATVLSLSRKQDLFIRIALIALAITDLYIILETGSIQGFMIYVAGLGIVGFLLIRSYEPLRSFQVLYLSLGIVGFVLTSLALNNVGPLARFVFGDTVLFRFDYWYAGWAMTTNNPIFGVGLDSYGDWYRELRGEIATLRTTPDRVTNTAHNIYLDISASGGFPLILAYLMLIGYALWAALRVIRRDSSFNPYFIALFATWVAYLIQAAVSINQIGVSIWGWLFTGALVGYEVATRQGAQRLTSKMAKSESTQLPASVALMGIAGSVVGFFVSFIPFNADVKFKDALQSANPMELFTQAIELGATAYHMELALDAAIRANNEALAGEVTTELLARYPRDFMAWRVKQVLATSTPEEREQAYLRLKEMDPFNPTIQRVG